MNNARITDKPDKSNKPNKSISDKQFITIANAATYSGLDQQTLRKMFDSSQITGFKTPKGSRRFDKSSLHRLCYQISEFESREKDIPGRRNFLYARVSTKKQMDDLSRQVNFLKRPEYVDYNVIQDIGSGINFKRKGLKTILDSCLQRTIGEVIVAHRDRLCRFGFELFQYLIETAGGSLKVLDSDQNTSSEDELSQDLLSIIHIFNCRQMGKRSY
jgi:putative resolvase